MWQILTGGPDLMGGDGPLSIILLIGFEQKGEKNKAPTLSNQKTQKTDSQKKPIHTQSTLFRKVLRG